MAVDYAAAHRKPLWIGIVSLFEWALQGALDGRSS